MQSFIIDGITCTRELGTGATGSVYLGQDPNGQMVAVKILIKDDYNPRYKKLHANMQKEIDALQNLNHPNIIKLVGAGLDVQWEMAGQQFQGDYLASELVPNGELFDFISCSKGSMSETIAKQAFKQMLAAVANMHRSHIINRDIKLENMLIGANFEIKMADFGFQQVLEGKDGDNNIRTRLGTPGYMAPEILEERDNYNGIAVDVYALGVVLFSIVTKSSPFSQISMLSQGQQVITQDPLYKLFVTNKQQYFGRYGALNLSPQFQSLISLMLHPDPAMRPSVQDIINHEWLSNGVASPDEYYQDMAGRKAAKDAENASANVPTIDNCPGARDHIRRSTGTEKKNYVLGELTEEQKNNPDKYKQLTLNLINAASLNIPNSKYISADMSAPDLFKWLNGVVDSMSGAEPPRVDDTFWKMQYTIVDEIDTTDATADDEEEDPDVSDLLFNANASQDVLKTSATICAEVLKIEGQVGKHVVEIRRVEGSPEMFNEHFQNLKTIMTKIDNQ